jgi:hypothetical protein
MAGFWNTPQTPCSTFMAPNLLWEATMKLVMNMRFAAYCVSAAALLAFGGSGVEAAFLTKNLQICDQGSFFVGACRRLQNLPTL